MNSEPGLKRFLTFAALFVVPMDAALLLLGKFGSDQLLRDYTDLASILPLSFVLVIMLMVIPKARDASLRRTTILLTAGFALQVGFFIVWIYYWHFTNRGGLPDVSIGDALYLGSYVFWTAATIPYIRRYWPLIGRKSLGILTAYGAFAALIVYISTKYWYDAAVQYGYSTLATVTWLSYPVAATLSLFLLIAVALLYGFEGYGKGLLTNYWLYFLLPVILIASADIMNGFYYTLTDNSVPGRLDDVTYLAGYAVTMAAALTLWGSRLDQASVIPSTEEHMLKGGAVKVVKGTGLIVQDPKSTLSFELFSRLMEPDETGSKKVGYILSRRAPKAIREEFGFKDVPITWISTQSGEDIVDPTKPNLMAHSVMEFLSRSKNGVVLFDGIESVMTNTDFGHAAKMLEQINDFVMQYQGYLIIPIDPNAFDEREYAILGRNFQSLAVPRVDA